MPVCQQCRTAALGSAEETGNDTHHFGARAAISMGEALSNCHTSSELRDCSTAGLGSILIPPLGITVQLGHHELTIVMDVIEEPNPAVKAEESQAESASSGVTQRPQAAVPQGLPGGAAVEGDWVMQSLYQGLCPGVGGQGQRGSSGTQLCTVPVFKPL